MKNTRPLVFIAGEGLRGRIWDESARFFGTKGYEVISLEYDYLSSFDSFEQQISFLSTEFCFESPASPAYSYPILVAHSLSTYLAQKLLEKGSVAGLVLVNPSPIFPTRATLKLFDRWISSLSHLQNERRIDESALRTALWRYYLGDGYRSWEKLNESSDLLKHSIRTPVPSSSFTHRISLHDFGDRRLTFPVPLKSLQENFLSYSSDQVNIDPGLVPTMLVYSCGDKDVITEEEKEQLRLLHRVPYSDQFYFEADKRREQVTHGDNSSYYVQANSKVVGSRLPMITHPQEFNRALSDWLKAAT